MSIYDILMLAVMAGAILFGLWKGLAWQIASLAAVLVSYFVAMQFRGAVATFINAEPPWNTLVAMLILFLATSLAIWIAFGFVKKWIEQWHLKSFDRQAGALLGALKGGLLCIVITLFAVSLLGEDTRQAICHSRSGGYIAKALSELTAVVPSEVNTVIAPYVDTFNDVMQEHGTVEQAPGFPSETQPSIQYGQFSSPGTVVPNENNQEFVGSLISRDPGPRGEVEPGRLLAAPQNYDPQQALERFNTPQFDLSEAASRLIEEAAKHLGNQRR